MTGNSVKIYLFPIVEKKSFVKKTLKLMALMT